MSMLIRILEALLGFLLPAVAMAATGTARQFASPGPPAWWHCRAVPAATTGRAPQGRSRKRRGKGLTLPLGQGSSIWCMSAPSDAGPTQIRRPAP